MNLGGTKLAAAAAMMLVLAGCGDPVGEKSKARSTETAAAIEPGSRAEAQKVLEKAEASVRKAGTGAFRLSANINRGMSIAGEWDLRAEATDYTMTMVAADNGQDVVVRTRILDNTGFTQVSTVDDPMCWMRLDSADREAVGQDPSISPIHPAALMLLEPHAVGFVKDSRVGGHQDVRAEMEFVEAAGAVMPKALNSLSKPPPDGATIPVTVGIDAGRYASIRYSVADIIRAAKASGVDLFGMTGEDAQAVEEELADARVEINYRSFGDKADIAEPAADLIMDVDLAALQESGGTAETCAAAR